MKSLLKSKIVAWIALFIIVVIIIATFKLRPFWWTFIDEFFAFMMIFSQLIAVYTYKLNFYAAKKLQMFAAIFGILMIISFIGEYIAYRIIFP